MATDIPGTQSLDVWVLFQRTSQPPQKQPFSLYRSARPPCSALFLLPPHLRFRRLTELGACGHVLTDQVTSLQCTRWHLGSPKSLATPRSPRTWTGMQRGALVSAWAVVLALW